MKCLCVLVLLVASQLASAQNISGLPFIAVHGQAKMEVVPDVFPLEITLKETSKNAADSQKRIESLASTIVALADAENIPDGDQEVGNLSISPEMDYDEKLEREIFLGNTYERVIKLRFRSLEALRQFIGKAPQAPQVQIDTGTFFYAAAAESKKKLMAAAIEDAHSTAEAMASGVGRTLAGVQTISNQGFNMQYAESYQLDRVVVSGTPLSAPSAVILKEGRVTLSQDVYIIYLLAD